MVHPKWQDLLIPPGDEDACWELFHENSKLSRLETFPSAEEIRKEMGRLHESLSFDGYPTVALPTKIPSISIPLGDAICARRSVRRLEPVSLDLETLAAILHYSYGRTGGNPNSPRSFRAVPSGGALYPLELYLYSASLIGQEPGFYHYDPRRHCVTLLNHERSPELLAETVVQPDILIQASMILFITALFERSVFKYRDRGYRFVLMEAGHLAQNIHLVLQGLGLSGVSIGGFYDREVDRILRLDGITHSTIYMMALGKNADSSVG